MMRLVTEHHPELVNQTHVHLGGELENENNYKEAEKHYVAGGDWKAAVNMWRGLESWEDAFRVSVHSQHVQPPPCHYQRDVCNVYVLRLSQVGHESLCFYAI